MHNQQSVVSSQQSAVSSQQSVVSHEREQWTTGHNFLLLFAVYCSLFAVY